jgi:hypothetical protein
MGGNGNGRKRGGDGGLREGMTIKTITSETQLIKYVPVSTEQECVCGFFGVSLFLCFYFFEFLVSV